MHTTTHAMDPAGPPALIWEHHPSGHSRAADEVHKFHVFQSGFRGKGGRHITAEISCRRTGRLVARAMVGTIAEAKIWCDSHRTWPAARRA